MTIAKAIARAWADDGYKAKLIADPHAALNDLGVDVPAGASVKVIENTVETTHFILPVAPNDAGELSIDELEKVAGAEIINGGAWTGT